MVHNASCYDALISMASRGIFDALHQTDCQHRHVAQQRLWTAEERTGSAARSCR